METDFAIEKVRLSVAEQTVEKTVTPEDTHASFTLELEAGDADLDTALIGDGNDGVAYFVTIEYNGPKDEAASVSRHYPKYNILYSPSTEP